MSSRALDEARAWVANNGGTLGEQLVAVGAIADDALTDFYRKRLLVPQVNPNTLARLPNRVIAAIPSDMAVELRAVPVSIDAENNLTVAMSDPSDRHAVDEIAFFTGAYVVRAVATQMQIAWCLAHYYGHVTSLGQRLLQPTNEAQPQPQPRPEAAPKPIPRVKGHTAKVEASRHRAIAPVTGPVNVQRPNSGELDLVGKFGAAAAAAADAAMRQPDVIPPPVRTAAPEAITPVETPRPPGVVARVTPVKIERRANDIIETVRAKPQVVVPPAALVPTASPSSPTLRESNPDLLAEPPPPVATVASSKPLHAQTPPPVPDDSDGSPDKPRARSVSGEIRVPVRRAPSIRPPMPEPLEDDDDSPQITVEVNPTNVHDDPTGPRMVPIRRRKAKTDPPELAARAGEIGGARGVDRKVDSDEPRIIISDDVDPSNRPPDVSGELRVIAHREEPVIPKTTIEVHDQDDDSAVIHEQLDNEDSEPVLLERRRPSDPVPIANQQFASVHTAATEPPRKSTRKKEESPPAAGTLEPQRKTLVGRPKPEEEAQLRTAMDARPSQQRKTLNETTLPGGSAAQPSQPEAPHKTLVGHSDSGAPLPGDAKRKTLDPNLTPTPLTTIHPPEPPRKTLVGHSAQIPVVDETDQPGETSDVVVLEARKPGRPTPDRLRPQKSTVIGIGATAAATLRSHRDTDASGVPAMVDDLPTEAVGPPDVGFEGQPDVDPTRVDLIAAPPVGEISDETLAAPPPPASEDTDLGARAAPPPPSAWDAPTRRNPIWDQPTRTAKSPDDNSKPASATTTSPDTGSPRATRSPDDAAKPASATSTSPGTPPKPASATSTSPGTGSPRKPAASSPSIRMPSASSPSIATPVASSSSIKPPDAPRTTSPPATALATSSPAIRTPASSAPATSSPAIRTPAGGVPPPPTTPGTDSPKSARPTDAGEGETTNPRGKPAPARTTPDPDNATTLPRMPPRVATPAVRQAATSDDDDDAGPTTNVMSAVELDEAIPDRCDDIVPGHLAKQRIDHDPVDDGWGPPGTTIPPPLLGAIPGSDDDELAEGPVSRIPMPDVDSAPLIVTPPSPPEPARGTPALDGGAPGLVSLLEDSTSRAIELIRALERSQSRDEVMKLMISHLAESHARAGFLSIKPDASRVNELSLFAMQPVPAVLPFSSLRLDKPSTLQEVVGTRLPYRGPMHDDASRSFLTNILGACPPEILLVPVAVRERVVGVLFGELRMRHTFDDQLALAARAAGMALERILKAKRT